MSDTGKQFGIMIRNNIAEIIHHIPVNAEITVIVETSTWKGVVLGITDAKRALANGTLSIAGDYIKFLQFSTMFDKE